MYTIVPVILVICYSMGEIYKIVFKKKTHKYIPAVLTSLGGLLGILIYITNPELLMVDDIYTAITLGLISGGSSIGAHQIVKQLIKKE